MHSMCVFLLVVSFLRGALLPSAQPRERVMGSLTRGYKPGGVHRVTIAPPFDDDLFCCRSLI